MELTSDQLSQIIVGNKYIATWFEALNSTLSTYNISSVERLSAFLAQTKHESANYTAIKENLNYRAESLIKVWPQHFPNMTIANKYAHNQSMIANRAYANRMGNGNEASGDGWKYCGRGLIQITGKSIYKEFATESGMNLDDVPNYLETFQGAVHSACFFWNKHNLNALADQENIREITRIINGGYLGLDQRTTYYNQIKDILTNG